MSSRATAAAAATAHKRVKRAQGLVRAAAALLAEARNLADADLVAEVHLDAGQADLLELVEVLEVARSRGGALDVIVLASPRPVPSSSAGHVAHAPRPEPDRTTRVG